ncbi:GPI transamidase component Gpi16 subunit family protein [Actinidia rufa]|uniref:GPI transamidase component Gpi16 subunit family protein n=1 Tax=Actinidia rufa TaxID=165716 RepID=A0A7J0HAH9_9ERIC|nr:GPI transamidase component Gpi16 subunit family protein [Actinidia rufa]
MALPRWMIFLFLFLLCFVSESVEREEHEEEEEFSEELLLKPLPDRKVLAHFHFQSRVPPTETYGRHHHLFPKPSINCNVQIQAYNTNTFQYFKVHKFKIQEMELSFTQGRWNYEHWGGYDPISSNNAKPPGVELWAFFDVPEHQVDASWKNLSHALSGLFCASINFLESSTTYSAPDRGFRSSTGNMRYGTLPREAVCTENLTPWLKLLPCRDKAGLSALMDRPSIYRGCYHSQRLHLTSTEFDSTGLKTGIVLEQTLTVVLKPNTPANNMGYSSGSILQPSWSLSSILGKKVSGKCLLAKSSNVYLQLEGALVSELNKIQKENERDNNDDLALKGSWRSPGFELSAPLHSSRFLMGSGNERGAIALSLISTKQSEAFQTADINGERCSLQVDVFQVVPWYVKVYYHTLQVFVDEQLQSVPDVIKKMRVSPSEDKVSPGVMEMVLKLPCGVKSAVLTIEFDKGFLHIDEYPPDANQGFDIPSAVHALQRHHNYMHGICSIFWITAQCTTEACRRGRETFKKQSCQKKNGRLPLLLSKLSAKLRGIPRAPPQSSSSSSSLISSKLLIKVVLAVGVAAGWQYYFG